MYKYTFFKAAACGVHFEAEGTGIMGQFFNGVYVLDDCL